MYSEPLPVSCSLTDNSANETILNEAKNKYEMALKINKKYPGEKRHIIWYNPPYNNNVNINVSKIFIKLKTSKLHKIFNL